MEGNEVYCGSCGKIIKSEAEICPYCNVQQKQILLSDSQISELQILAGKSIIKDIFYSLALPPLPFGYMYVGKGRIALINLLTLNYFLLGVIIVPIHLHSMISNARKDLDAMGVDY